MKPEITTFNEQIFIGKRMKTSFMNNQTFALWKKFIPRRQEIKNAVGVELYSIEIYPPGFFEKFNPSVEFEKWAAVKTADFSEIPHDLEMLKTPAGLYAVFLYQGKSSEVTNFFQVLFKEWLPESNYLLDERPHFCVMGEKYKNDDPRSEEEICIPIKPKSL